MTDKGCLGRIFIKHMSLYTHLINTLPDDLIPKKGHLLTLNKGVKDFIHFPIEKKALTSADHKMFSILFLGPTGCGKSTLINQMFNKNVCKADCGIHSVTKEINYIQGTYTMQFATKIDGAWKSNKTFDVNVIDTVGFCDSLLSADQVLSLVKDSVKVNLAYIDKVVICVSGRMEADHKKSIEQFMKWLRYEDNKPHYAFFYTKTDGMAVDDIQRNLLQICKSLDIDSQSGFIYENEEGHSQEMKLVNAISFAPNASSDELSMNREKLMNVISYPPAAIVGSKHRIEVSPSMCNIL